MVAFLKSRGLFLAWPGLLLGIALFSALWLETTTSQPAAAVTPTFSVPGGYYDKTVFLELTTPTQAAIWFTTDGRYPTPTTAIRYTKPLRLDAAQPAVIVIRARLQSPDGRLGPVVDASYFMNIEAHLPLISLIIEPDDFDGPERGIYTHFEERGRAWERPITITYIDTDRQAGFTTSAGIRIHGRGSRLIDKKGFRLYFRNEYGLSRLDYPLFDTGEVQTFKRLVLHNSGQDATLPGTNWTLMRNQLVAALARQMGGIATRSQPVLLFINGQLWGIYQLRERIDAHFLADQYGIETADMLDTPEELIRTDHVILGDRQHWDAMLDFATTHDLTDPAHYAYLQTQMDMANYIDYNLLQIYVANDDWPHHNMRVFRPRTQGGRWQWMFWDVDRSFAFRLASPVDKDMITHAQTDQPTASGRQTELLRHLLANPTFRNTFLVRLAMLLNTSLSPEAVLAQIDTLASMLAPDIHYEVGVWPADGTTWAANIEELRDFARRRPDFVRQHVVAGLQLPGTAVWHIEPSPFGVVLVEGEIIDTAWQGVFFQDTIVEITAVPHPGYQFAGWETVDGAAILRDGAATSQDGAATLHLAVTGDLLLQPRFVPIPADAPQVGDVVITAVGVDDGPKGDWIELEVIRPGGVDLRQWRLTDNDSQTATDEGSLIFTDQPALAHLPAGTRVLIVTHWPPLDDAVDMSDTMVLTMASDAIDTDTDPWFNLNDEDVVVLWAPGPTAAFADDHPIAIYIPNLNTPASNLPEYDIISTITIRITKNGR